MQLFSDKARTTLSVSASDTATSIQVASGARFPTITNPGDFFKLVLEDADGNFEIVYCTAHSGNGQMTVQRGRDGTARRSFLIGAIVALRPVASDARGIREAVDGLSAAVDDLEQEFSSSFSTVPAPNKIPKSGAEGTLQQEWIEGLVAELASLRSVADMYLESTVRDIFANGEQGAWYDPSDLSSMFQDAVGTIPAAVDQPVGLLLDKRLGLVRGDERVGEPEIKDTSYWTPSNVERVLITDNGAVFVEAGTGNSVYSPNNVTPVGAVYEFTVVVGSISSGALRLSAGRGSATKTAAVYAGVNHIILPATGTTSNVSGQVSVYASTPGTNAVVKSISVRELPGNHASQETTTARPVLRRDPLQIFYDGVDDSLNTAFSAPLGHDCTVARAIPGVGAQILTGQTINAEFTDTVTNCALIVVDRALTGPETTGLTAYLNLRSGT